MKRELVIAAAFGLAACSDGGGAKADFDLQCEGMALSLRSDVADATALPRQRYRVSGSSRTVSRILADGTLDNLCLPNAKCDVTIDGSIVRASSVRDGGTLDFFFDRRTGSAYHITRVLPGGDRRLAFANQMSCKEI